MRYDQLQLIDISITLTRHINCAKHMITKLSQLYKPTWEISIDAKILNHRKTMKKPPPPANYREVGGRECYGIPIETGSPGR